MGSELVTDSPNPDGGGGSPASFSFTEVFEKQLPFYLCIGMTWDEFWNDDVTKAKYYREAHKLKNKADNEKLWLLGAYFYNALCDVAPVLHAFAKAGTKPKPYLAEPVPLTKAEAEANEKERERREYEAMKEKLILQLERANSKFKKSQGGETPHGFNE